MQMLINVTLEKIFNLIPSKKNTEGASIQEGAKNRINMITLCAWIKPRITDQSIHTHCLMCVNELIVRKGSVLKRTLKHQMHCLSLQWAQ